MRKRESTVTTTSTGDTYTPSVSDLKVARQAAQG